MHLRSDPQALQQALALYVRALEVYDRPVLEMAWQDVASRRAMWCWPEPGELTQAAERFHREIYPAGNDEWVAQANDLADQYTRRFMKSSAVAAKARGGGYEAELRAYVRAASWVQAQALAGHKGGIDYESSILFTQGESKEEQAAWLDRAQEQAMARNGIKVMVPPTMLKRWAAAAEKGRGR